MRIIKKVSFTILALTISAQLGLVSAPQEQGSDLSTSKTLQKFIFPANPSAEAAIFSVHFRCTNSSSASIVYLHEGNWHKHNGISEHNFTELFIDEGTTYTVEYNGYKTRHEAQSDGQWFYINGDASLTYQ